jgi:hypothetical protein
LKVLLGIVIGIVAIAVVGVLVLGYLGFVPGISNLFGSNKPKNLGTTFTTQDYKSAIAKSGVQFLSNADTVSLATSQKTYGPAKAVNADFTPAEIMAVMNDKAHAPNFPLKDMQLRINPDGTTEVSAVLMMDKVSTYATSHGVSGQALNDTMDQIKKAGGAVGDVPVYMKGTAAVNNGQLSFEAQSVEVGRLPISADLVNGHKSDLSNYYDTHKSDVPGFSCKTFSLTNGKVHFDGTLPSTVKPK